MIHTFSDFFIISRFIYTALGRIIGAATLAKIFVIAI